MVSSLLHSTHAPYRGKSSNQLPQGIPGLHWPGCVVVVVVAPPRCSSGQPVSAWCSRSWQVLPTGHLDSGVCIQVTFPTWLTPALRARISKEENCFEAQSQGGFANTFNRTPTLLFEQRMTGSRNWRTRIQNPDLASKTVNKACEAEPVVVCGVCGRRQLRQREEPLAGAQEHFPKEPGRKQTSTSPSQHGVHSQAFEK